MKGVMGENGIVYYTSPWHIKSHVSFDKCARKLVQYKKHAGLKSKLLRNTDKTH